MDRYVELDLPREDEKHSWEKKDREGLRGPNTIGLKLISGIEYAKS